MIKVVLDYDGTLTAEERQVPEVTRRSLMELADHILRVPLGEVEAAYADTVARLRAEPHEYHWEVNGLRVSYCDEGAFILNTVALQTMLAEDSDYLEAVRSRFDTAGYDPVATCTNHLFHSHTATMETHFRESASEVLRWLAAHPEVEPLVLTNSLGDKVERNLGQLDVAPIRILGDTRQYDLDPGWTPPFGNGEQFVLVDDLRTVDLRRRVYYDALVRESADGSSLVVVADSLSLPGALPLEMGIPFALLSTSYTPDWCAAYVEQHSLGTVLDSLAALPSWVEQLLKKSLFVPSDFVVPSVFETERFRLRMLSVDDVEKDYEAVIESRELLHSMFGGTWPREGFTLKENLADLERHQREFLKRKAFAYTVVSLDESRVLGCLYINPPRGTDADATAVMWVRQSEYDKGLDAVLFQEVRDWIASSWPFAAVAYPDREQP